MNKQYYQKPELTYSATKIWFVISLMVTIYLSLSYIDYQKEIKEHNAYQDVAELTDITEINHLFSGVYTYNNSEIASGNFPEKSMIPDEISVLVKDDNSISEVRHWHYEALFFTISWIFVFISYLADKSEYSKAYALWKEKTENMKKI